jgi:molybdopterin synthase catalytic subunit
MDMTKIKKPSISKLFSDAKKSKNATKCGMFLLHNGTVRVDAKIKVREGKKDTKKVTGMIFDYDKKKVDAAIKKALKLPGIYYVKVWLNNGKLKLGDDIMLVLVGGDIRPRVIDCLQSLVGEIKTKCVIENELY